MLAIVVTHVWFFARHLTEPCVLILPRCFGPIGMCLPSTIDEARIGVAPWLLQCSGKNLRFRRFAHVDVHAA